MDTRKLRIVKPPLPAIGICESCNAQFKSGKHLEYEVEDEIKAAVDAHECQPDGSNQKVRGYMDET